MFTWYCDDNYNNHLKCFLRKSGENPLFFKEERKGVNTKLYHFKRVYMVKLAKIMSRSEIIGSLCDCSSKEK